MYIIYISRCSIFCLCTLMFLNGHFVCSGLLSCALFKNERVITAFFLTVYGQSTLCLNPGLVDLSKERCKEAQRDALTESKEGNYEKWDAVEKQKVR